MSDIVDLAAEMEVEHLQRSLRRINAAIPAGVSGECDDCGELMPRLVDGRCGFCRDGRLPPANFYDRADPAPPIPSTVEECPPMPVKNAIAATRKIEFAGTALGAIERRAEQHDIPFKQAAADLIGLAIGAASPACAPVVSEPAKIHELPMDDLLTELARRISQAAPAHLLDAAIARAEAAEGQLATIQQVLTQVRSPIDEILADIRAHG